ncbi:uncharacterized protein LOC129597770 isoform X2 [Paramacrobiotus metropolitanus]|uniref:uncharacterized protein LOC129597770 isoform X2 n=1 Tax=Paramacrobiotus metropolitanus TaxID=2943436 RepID=UPI002445C8BC|nr:uncharacterized protein LOC129597770 isoform X2 [Paramacrobiotus metropolitanus]
MRLYPSDDREKCSSAQDLTGLINSASSLGTSLGKIVDAVAVVSPSLLSNLTGIVASANTFSGSVASSSNSIVGSSTGILSSTNTIGANMATLSTLMTQMRQNPISKINLRLDGPRTSGDLFTILFT